MSNDYIHSSHTDVVKRLRRAEGHLRRVIEMFGDKRSCLDLAQQLHAVEKAIAEQKPGCVLMETISNPLLRVGQMDHVAQLAKAAGAALVVDNTFATPLLVRPLELGANLVVHSLTKFLAGHGDVLGGERSHCVEHHSQRFTFIGAERRKRKEEILTDFAEEHTLCE